MLNLEDKKHLLNSSDRSYRALSWFECLHEHLKIAKMGIFEFFCSELLKCGKGLWPRLFFFSARFSETLRKIVAGQL